MSFCQRLHPTPSRKGLTKAGKCCLRPSSKWRKVSLSPKRDPKKTTTPRLIVISAPSGAGKTTLCDMLLKEFPQIALSVSTTTRGKRPYEKDGVHYHFVTEEVFKKKI